MILITKRRIDCQKHEQKAAMSTRYHISEGFTVNKRANSYQALSPGSEIQNAARLEGGGAQKYLMPRATTKNTQRIIIARASVNAIETHNCSLISIIGTHSEYLQLRVGYGRAIGHSE